MQQTDQAVTVLDARGLATPLSHDRQYFWAVSGFDSPQGAYISVMATCFDSTAWFVRCLARDAVKHVADEVGALLSEQDLLTFLQEALQGGGATVRQQQPQPQPQRTQRALSASQAPPSQAASQLQALSQRPNGGVGNLANVANGNGHQQPEPAAALTLELPQPWDAGLDAAFGMDAQGTAGVGEATGEAALTVRLPPCRFAGGDVRVRLPPPPRNMERVVGEEAQRACMTLVSNMHQQLNERREQLERSTAELTLALEENAQLRNQLTAVAAAGGGTGPTPREQYGLAGAPPPLPGGAAKRQRTAPPAQLQQLLSGGLEDLGVGGGGGGGGRASSGALAAAAGGARGFASQPAPAVLPLSQLESQASMQAPRATQAGGHGGGGGGGAGGLLLPSQREPPPPSPRVPEMGLGLGPGSRQDAPLATGFGTPSRPMPASASAAAGAASPVAVRTVTAAVASVAAVAVNGSSAAAVGGTALAVVKAEQAQTTTAAGPVPSSLQATEGGSGMLASQTVGQAPPSQAQAAAGAAAGGAVAGAGAPRDPSRVGVTIRTTGLGRGAQRGGRGGLRR